MLCVTTCCRRRHLARDPASFSFIGERTAARPWVMLVHLPDAVMSAEQLGRFASGIAFEFSGVLACLLADGEQCGRAGGGALDRSESVRQTSVTLSDVSRHDIRHALCDSGHLLMAGGLAVTTVNSQSQELLLAASPRDGSIWPRLGRCVQFGWGRPCTVGAARHTSDRAASLTERGEPGVGITADVAIVRATR